jgi:hypothetical protein
VVKVVVVVAAAATTNIGLSLWGGSGLGEDPCNGLVLNRHFVQLLQKRRITEDQLYNTERIAR